VVLYHGFEPWVETLVKASGTKAKLAKIPGPWNTPIELAKRYRAVALALEEVLGVKLRGGLSKCLKAINETGAELETLAERLGIVHVALTSFPGTELGLNNV